ncbi:MAG: hypothetical protein GFH27_549287n135 [Chloroflexi bacterium AL-W]|nr:hypothetical protein [Chloroflexi bacterium AL-N1]NOK66409.1 hypothetical protein [Chloroflexi bacterium AL-N10]NOK71797.1 hypothetical protein [Chloroflexi bacterium AL-N5]NOK81054.1 hypothetical protein [Chloroflexi bacterium AL-W]NOK89327.1 hypothetical protein [Chloroflexi bacterium AL-N15]
MVHPQALINMFGYNAELTNKQLADATHEESLLPLPFEANCLNWVWAISISSRTMALQLVGTQPLWTDAQRVRYRYGSPNSTEGGVGVIRLAMLLTIFNQAQEHLVDGFHQMTYQDMCEPSGYHDNSVGG